jgi:glycosyltransferase involved in cell wall biosynthesis
MIDDLVPEASLGSGYPRMIETINTIQSIPGVVVSLYPTLDLIYPSNQVGAIRPWRGELPLEVITDELDEHLLGKELTGSTYDLVIISRPHNYDFVIKTIKRHLPFVPVIYDAEALFYRRMERQVELIPKKDRKELERATKKMRRLEEKIAVEADELVFVSSEEADIMRPLAHGPITVHSPLLDSVRWTPKGFAERFGVGYIASWAAGPKSPNLDGMQWFAREVWPRVLARLPEAKLYVTGAKPDLEVLRFACESISFVGRVEDLEQFYGDLRVVVVPNRFGAGVKNKTIEALQSGVPTVSTVVGAEGVPIPGFVDGTVSDEPWCPSFLRVVDDVTAFAKHIVELATDEQIWERDRKMLHEQCLAWDQDRTESAWTDVIDRAVPPVSPAGVDEVLRND